MENTLKSLSVAFMAPVFSARSFFALNLSTMPARVCRGFSLCMPMCMCLPY
ncbi:MAG: hypothetical protein PUA61_03010 [Succinatimonas hippei]|nr:hypothetical protein [Succinatimonas hippei]